MVVAAAKGASASQAPAFATIDAGAEYFQRS